MRPLVVLWWLAFPAAMAAAPPASQPSSSPAIRQAVGTASPPGGVRLIEGYRHERLQGIDSSPGRIWRDGGLEVRYDIGGMAGNLAGGLVMDGTVAWQARQVVGGCAVQIVKTHDGLLVASFPGERANFYAKVASEKDVVEFLAIALTYPLAPAPR